MAHLYLCLSGALLTAALPAAVRAQADLPAAVAEARDAIFADCRGAGGIPTAEEGFITARDLNGDGLDDHVVNLHMLTCEKAYSFFCGSAGCPVSVWLSGPDGATVAWSSHAQDVVWDGTTLIAYLHGQFCTPPRIGAEGCEERLSFDGAGAGTAAAAPEAPAAASAAAPPPADRWTLRRPGNAPPVAVIGGPGNLRSLAAFCLDGQPWLALLFTDPPASDAIRVDFGFSGGTLWGPAARGPATGGAYMIGLAGHGLAGALAGSDRQVALSVDGQPLGTLSLSGSSRQLRAALGACHRF